MVHSYNGKLTKIVYGLLNRTNTSELEWDWRPLSFKPL